MYVEVVFLISSSYAERISIQHFDLLLIHILLMLLICCSFSPPDLCFYMICYCSYRVSGVGTSWLEGGLEIFRLWQKKIWLTFLAQLGKWAALSCDLDVIWDTL